MIYVVSHKETRRIASPFYSIIAVGSNKEGDWFDLRDDDISDGIEDHISEKNPYYCELTAIYWLWKHCRDNVIGICHYRRYFVKKKKWDPDLKTLLDKNDIHILLNNYDMILPPYHSFRSDITHYTLRIYGELEHKIAALLRESIQSNYPEYTATYDEVSTGYQSYAWNMFICKKEIYEQYCKWLFTILFDLEKKINVSIDISQFNKEQKRLYGFVSEHLITVWIKKNDIKVYESNFIFTEENRSLKGRILKWLHYKSYLLNKIGILKKIGDKYDKTDLTNKSIL